MLNVSNYHVLDKSPMKSKGCLFCAFSVPFLRAYSCISQKVSCAFSRRAEIRHKLGHNDFNAIGDKAQKRHRKGTRKCRVFSLHRVAVPFVCLFGWEYILPPKAQKHPRRRTGQIVVSMAGFFGTVQKDKWIGPNFLEPAKKIFGASA